MFNFKSQNIWPRFFRGLAIFSLVPFLAGCSYLGTDTRETLVSGIQPAPVLIPDTARINLTAPTDASTLSIAAGATFNFDTRDPAYAALYIFNQAPTVDASSSFVVNMVGICHGGATNLAGHTWNNLTLQLSSVLSGTQLYKCTSSNVDLLSTTQKLVFDAVNFDQTGATTYHWAVLGYNQYYQLTHSSEVRTFTVGP